MGELAILTEIGLLAVEAFTLCNWHKSNAAEDMLSFRHSLEILVRRMSEAATKCAYDKECPRCHRRLEHDLDSDEAVDGKNFAALFSSDRSRVLFREISCSSQ